MLVGIMKLDETDRALLALLSANARISTVALSKKLGLSRTTVQSRIERLERRGIIQGYTVTLAPDADLSIRAHVMIAASPHTYAVVENQLRQQRGVLELYAVSGKMDMIAIIAAPNMEMLNTIIDRIGALDGVQRTQSSIILSTRIKQDTGYTKHAPFAP
ncbi:Lrp/AsnC family transcriptional regulator [Acetobacter sp.]|uniref:Lrp/AsnC family transcriptional regulator n=1 Tax=Acetobacter sp. TaxID=440 RepID=UPI0039E95CC7